MIEKLQTPTAFTGRLPRQIQRALPVYLACILIIFIISHADSLGAPVRVAERGFSHQKPLALATKFPRKIWQTWKVDPLGFEERDSSCARTWTSKNPGYRYEVLTDSNDLMYVESHYGPAGLNRPDIVETYRSLTAKIIKADLLRYLVMYVDGGLYTDLDVEALNPTESFIPDRYKEGDIDMVIGVEIDQPEFKDHAILGPKSQSFCQWTFMAKPGLPVLRRLVGGILLWLQGLSESQGVPISQLQLDFDEVISGTGPSAFTSAILAEISAGAGHAVTWDSFHAMRESKLIGGAAVLTVEAFAAGQGHSDSGNHNARTALVEHRYDPSGWPTCIQLWDANTAAFKALSIEEQAKMVAIKEVGDAQEAAAALAAAAV
ncbi:hypothetical protein VE04_10030 [Pseudogymnoascus sp. 24MN13]|nr:hypothetical protein VE04_10030 [Pseudogymnoascus sp. 24MN13]